MQNQMRWLSDFFSSAVRHGFMPWIAACFCLGLLVPAMAQSPSADSGGEASESQTVVADLATTTITIDSHEPDPSAPDQEVMVGYTVSGVGGTPTGTVTVFSGSGNPVCSGPLDGDGRGACSLSFERVGNYSLSARYGGDDDFQPSVSTPVQHTVIGVGTTPSMTTITSDIPDPSTTEQVVLVSFRVLPADGALGIIPSGRVEVDSGGGPACEALLNDSGVGSCTLRFQVPGQYPLTARYLGNATFAAGRSAPESHTVTEPVVPSLTTIIADQPDPSLVDETVTVRFQVVAASVIPTGTVTVNTAGGGPGCSGVLDGDGRGHCELVFDTPGEYLLEASYPGDDWVLGSTASEPHGVIPLPRSPTQTYISAAAPDPSGQGKWLAVGYQVVSEGEGVSSGEVVVSAADGGPECRGGLGADGLGSCWLLFMQAGSYRLSAEYLGNDVYEPSVSAVEPHRVVPGELVPSQVAIINHYPDPSATTESVAVRVVVRSADATVKIVPGGTVAVRAGSGASCRASLDGDGRGRCVLRIATPGEWSLSARYESDGLFADSTSPAVVHTVCDPDNPTASGIPACRDFPQGLLLRGGFE